MIEIQPSDLANVQMAIIMIFVIAILFFLLHVVLGFLLKRTIKTIDGLNDTVQDFKTSILTVVKDTDVLRDVSKEHGSQLKEHEYKLHKHETEITVIKTKLGS